MEWAGGKSWNLAEVWGRLRARSVSLETELNKGFRRINAKYKMKKYHTKSTVRRSQWCRWMEDISLWIQLELVPMLRHGQTRRDGQVINRKLNVGIGKHLAKGGEGCSLLPKVHNNMPWKAMWQNQGPIAIDSVKVQSCTFPLAKGPLTLLFVPFCTTQILLCKTTKMTTEFQLACNTIRSNALHLQGTILQSKWETRRHICKAKNLNKT